MNNDIKQVVLTAAANKYPNEVHLIESLSEEVWKEYRQLIRLYKAHHSVEVGWYGLIRYTLLNLEVDQRLAHILSDLRGDIGF